MYTLFINIMENETVKAKIFLAAIRKYTRPGRYVKAGSPSSIILTDKRIISKYLGFIKIGEIQLSDVISFKLIQKEWMGTTYFSKGIVISYKEDGKVNQEVIGVTGKSFDNFVAALKSLKITQK